MMHRTCRWHSGGRNCVCGGRCAGIRASQRRARVILEQRQKRGFQRSKASDPRPFLDDMLFGASINGARAPPSIDLKATRTLTASFPALLTCTGRRFGPIGWRMGGIIGCMARMWRGQRPTTLAGAVSCSCFFFFLSLLATRAAAAPPGQSIGLWARSRQPQRQGLVQFAWGMHDLEGPRCCPFWAAFGGRWDRRISADVPSVGAAAAMGELGRLGSC